MRDPRANQFIRFLPSWNRPKNRFFYKSRPFSPLKMLIFFSTLSTPRFFCRFFSKFLGVPPDFFQIFVKKSLEIFKFFGQKIGNFIFFLEKIRKIFQFFLRKNPKKKNLSKFPNFLVKKLEISFFFEKKSENIWFSRNFQNFWQKKLEIS